MKRIISTACVLFLVISEEPTHHFSLSLAPAENVELLSTSPISSRQKLKLLIVHMYENFITLTCSLITNNVNQK